MNNEEKFKEYKINKILRYSIIVLSFLIIFLEALALFNVISYLWGLIPFIISCIVKYIYEFPDETLLCSANSKIYRIKQSCSNLKKGDSK